MADSNLRQHEQTGFNEYWKLYINLCSLREHSPRRFLTNLKRLGFWQLKLPFAVCLTNFKTSSTICLDWNKNGGGIMLSTLGDISGKFVSTDDNLLKTVMLN